MSKSDKHDSDRRAFLRGGAAVGAAAGLVATAPAVASTEIEADVETEVKPVRKGYRVTKHVAAYYKNLAS